jgi:uncharacterized protein YecT (DUF1311 family)
MSGWMVPIDGFDWDGTTQERMDKLQGAMSPDQDVDKSSDAALSQATSDQRAANAAMTTTWDRINPDTKAKILADQRAWIAQEAGDCNRQADAASSSIGSRTVHAKCDAQATMTRVKWLQQYAHGR